MLLSLSVRDVVLIDRLELDFKPGLTALTGETGAGKSILLDALGLAIGARADSALVRRGAELASVSAEFALPDDHPARVAIADQGLAAEGNIILRRQIGTDGRSRAFINDEPVSVGGLRRVGDLLVEIEGQFEQHRLLDAASHRPLLDAFGGAAADALAVAAAWRAWRESQNTHREAVAAATAAARERDDLRHALDEIVALDPRPGEEAALADQRVLLRHREAMLEGLDTTLGDLEGERGALAGLAAAQRRLGRLAEKAAGHTDEALAALDRAGADTAEAAALLRRLAAELDADPRRLNRIEERLYALRELARKHGTTADELAALHERLAARLATIEGAGGRLAALASAENEARASYLAAAERLSRRRAEAGKRLDVAVNRELSPLKLEKARFRTGLERLGEEQWGEHGLDRIAFEASTNPGAPPAPIARVASGGELARFLLALKVALAEADPVPTLIFDEADSSVGGATATAVGERLVLLGKTVQVLAVTHSPQVAALARHHWRIEKGRGKGGTALTRAAALDGDGRREEIARMLSGATVTDEARAAASRLLGTSAP